MYVDGECEPSNVVDGTEKPFEGGEDLNGQRSDMEGIILAMLFESKFQRNRQADRSGHGNQPKTGNGGNGTISGLDDSETSVMELNRVQDIMTMLVRILMMEKLYFLTNPQALHAFRGTLKLRLRMGLSSS